MEYFDKTIPVKTFKSKLMRKPTTYSPNLNIKYSKSPDDQAYKIQLLLVNDSNSFLVESSFRWSDKLKCDAAIVSIKRNAKHAVVKEINSVRNIETAPLLFDSSNLLEKAKEELGFSNQLTSNIAKSLYLSGLITNPNTNDKYISPYHWQEIHMLLQLLGDKDTYKSVIDRLKWERLNRTILSNKQILNHGILPLDYPRPSLSVKEKALQNLIICQTLEALSQPCVREITSIQLCANEHLFNIKTEKILSIGWRAVKGHVFTKEALAEIPELFENQCIKIKKTEILGI